jgi:hypothetical protein
LRIEHFAFAISFSAPDKVPDKVGDKESEKGRVKRVVSVNGSVLDIVNSRCKYINICKRGVIN